MPLLFCSFAKFEFNRSFAAETTSRNIVFLPLGIFVHGIAHVSNCFFESEVSLKIGGNRQSLSKQAESALQFLVLPSCKRRPDHKIVLAAHTPE